MKTTRTTKVIVIAVVCIALFSWLASEFTSPPKTRARRINTEHNIVTAPIAAPASASTQPAAAPSAPGQR